MKPNFDRFVSNQVVFRVTNLTTGQSSSQPINMAANLFFCNCSVNNLMFNQEQRLQKRMPATKVIAQVFEPTCDGVFNYPAAYAESDGDVSYGIYEGEVTGLTTTQKPLSKQNFLGIFGDFEMKAGKKYTLRIENGTNMFAGVGFVKVPGYRLYIDGVAKPDTLNLELFVGYLPTAVNISKIEDQKLCSSAEEIVVPFSYSVSIAGNEPDEEIEADIQIASADESIINPEDVTITGTGLNREIHIKSVDGASGSVELAVIVETELGYGTKSFNVLVGGDACGNSPKIQNRADTTACAGSNNPVYIPISIGEGDTSELSFEVTADAAIFPIDGRKVSRIDSSHAVLMLTPAKNLLSSVEPTEVTVTVKDVLEKSASTTFKVGVKVFENPDIRAIGSTTFCHGSSVKLYTGPYQKYQWTKDDNFISGATYGQYIANSGGVYAVQVTAANGCKGAVSQKVSEEGTSLLGISHSGLNLICPQDSIVMSVDAGKASYQWLLGGKVIVGESSNTLVVKQSGVYAAISVSAAGCLNTSINAVVVVKPAPATPTIKYRYVDVTELICTQADAYQWYYSGSPITDAKNQSYFAGKEGDYYAVVTNKLGCSAKSNTINVKLNGLGENGSSDLFNVFPNPFTTEIHITSVNSGNYQLMDVTGKVILTGIVDAGENRIPTSELSEGVYQLMITSGSETSVVRLVK